MIEVHITMTGKSYSRNDTWRMIDRETLRFSTMAEAKAGLAMRYPKCKRVPMYRDTKAGTKRVGYVYGFRNADWSHSPVEKWLQQDWVSFSTCVEVTL